MIRTADLLAKANAGKPVREYPFSNYAHGLSEMQLDKFSMLPGIEQLKVQEAIKRGQKGIGKLDGMNHVFNPLPFDRKGGRT